MGSLRSSVKDSKNIREEFEIGQTSLGRQIVAAKFSPPGYAKPRDPAVLFAAIHGDEPIGVYCLAELASELDARPPGRETWIVYCLNLDGVAAGSKNNARDVDLNRNFASRNWTRDHKAGYNPGASAESEPETQALVNLITETSATRLISLHSPFRMVNWDGGGEALAKEMAALNGYELTGDMGYPTPGSFGSKYGVDQGLEVVTLEIPFLPEETAWEQNRAALKFCVDLPS